MKTIQTLGLILLLALATACNSSTESKDAVDMKEERRKDIEKREKDLIENADFTLPPNKIKADELIRLYRDFANVNRDDSLSADYLFRAADLSIGIQKYDQAVGLLDGIIENFPNYDRRVEIMYFKGFVYENHMDQFGKAKEAYQAVIDRYPNHRLAHEAQAAIHNLSISDEELIEFFKKKNAETASEGA